MNEEPTLLPEVFPALPDEERMAASAAWGRLTRHDPEAMERFDHAYCGHYDSAAAWAKEVVASIDVDQILRRQIPDWVVKHLTLDYDGLARDWVEMGEVHIEADPAGGVWVFDRRARSP